MTVGPAVGIEPMRAVDAVCTAYDAGPASQVTIASVAPPSATRCGSRCRPSTIEPNATSRCPSRLGTLVRAASG